MKIFQFIVQKLIEFERGVYIKKFSSTLEEVLKSWQIFKHYYTYLMFLISTMEILFVDINRKILKNWVLRPLRLNSQHKLKELYAFPRGNS